MLLMFEFQGAMPDEVARLAGSRLGSQFRHYDLIGRWSEREFVVLFRGREETARKRGEQIVPWLAGRYEAGRQIGDRSDRGVPPGRGCPPSGTCDGGPGLLKPAAGKLSREAWLLGEIKVPPRPLRASSILRRLPDAAKRLLVYELS